jgi:hypothetical protein
MKKRWLVGAGLLLIFIAMILQGSDSPATVIALVAGMILMFLGCFSWAYKLHWYVALTIGGMMLVAAYFAGAYIPLIVSYRGEDMPGFFIHLVNFALGIPAIVLISAGVASLFRSSYH